MADDTPTIIVPAHLRRLYEDAMRYMHEASALEIANGICDKLSDFDEDSLTLMGSEEEKRRFAVDKLLDAMDVTCPKCSAEKNHIQSGSKRRITASDCKAKFCTRCRTPIVLEWEVV